ncbi:MAG: hypothetical protein FD126_2128, partial [Elusimicrobia bacterium]
MLSLLMAVVVSASAAVTSRFAPTPGDSDGVKTKEETLSDSQDALRVSKRLSDGVYADLAELEAPAARSLADALKGGWTAIEGMDAVVSQAMPALAAHKRAYEHLKEVKDELATLLDAKSRPERLREFADRLEAVKPACGGAGSAKAARELHALHSQTLTALRNVARLRIELPEFLKSFKKESTGILSELKKADKAAAQAYAKAVKGVLTKGKNVAKTVPATFYAPVKKPKGNKAAGPSPAELALGDVSREAVAAVRDLDWLTDAVKMAHDSYPAVPARASVAGGLDAAKDAAHR